MLLMLGALLLPIAAAAAGPTQAQLEREKLQQEIRQLKHQNDRASSAFGTLLDLAPFLTVLAAVAAVVVPLRSEAKKQRAQRQAEFAQRELEQQRRLDDLFAQAVGNLGSDNESVRVSAAVTLENLLRPGYEPLHDQVYAVLRANLGVKHTPLVNRFLVDGFERAIRLHLAPDGSTEPVDLVGCHLPRVDLSKLNLEGADLAFATLHDANLRNADLHRARGIEVDLKRATLSDADLTEARFNGAKCPGARFHNARLVSAEFRPSERGGADLSKAEFYGARLQGAHLDGADLRGARFENANLSDAYFEGAQFDPISLRSIVNAEAVGQGQTRKPSWLNNARFDEPVIAELKRLSGRT